VDEPDIAFAVPEGRRRSVPRRDPHCNPAPVTSV
jgi:hypothetical protein